MPEAFGHRPDVVRNGALLQASPPGNGCRSVRSVRSWSESKSKSISVAAQTPPPSLVSTTTIELRYPVSRVRIPSRVLSIPRPIANPTPSLLYHTPFQTGSGQECLATEVTENTEASHLSPRLSHRWQTDVSLCELCALCGSIRSDKARAFRRRLQAKVADPASQSASDYPLGRRPPARFESRRMGSHTASYLSEFIE